jgi:signal transduction histidine kinase
MSARQAYTPDVASKSKTPGQERELTDDRLRAERDSADEAMTELRSSVDENADTVVERARERADAVLETARDRADQSLDPVGSGIRARVAIAAGRTLEDAVVRNERAAADDRLRRERDQQVRVLAALLPLERESTDRALLTERSHSDDQLTHRDDFLGMVSHDLRNLLCALVMESSELSDKASDSEEGRRTVAAMKRFEQYAARMNRLLGDLFDIVSIDSGRLAVRPERHDAVEVLVEAVQTYLPAAVTSGVTLHCETGDHALLASFDSGRILQVLANLVANALKFTPRGGRIVVRGERAGEDLRISVSDTGVGIPNDQIEAVFERFWQAREGDRRGLGLGLYISRCIIEAHGGRIWVESTPGKGSSFFFTIPGEVPQPA